MWLSFQFVHRADAYESAAEYSEKISAEAEHRGMQQGVLIEKAWQLYCERRRL